VGTRILGLLAFGLLAEPMVAHAVTVSAGESVLWSFDLTGTMPAPPFLLGGDRLVSNFADFSAEDAGYWTLYADASGTAQVVQFTELFAEMHGHNWILDGIGSARLTMTAGSLDASPCAGGIGFLEDGGGFGETPCVAGVLVTDVAESGTLALLGLGLLGLGVVRRRAE
jgi:hypothetical protein